MNRKRKWITIDSPHEPVTRVACRALENRLLAVWDYLPQAAKQADEDPEHVHQLRVSSRRAMAAVETFECFLPNRRTEWFKKQLRRVRRAAGDARDFDVLADRLAKTLEHDSSPAARRILKLAAECRCDAQPAIGKIHKRLKDRKYKRRVAKLLKKVRPHHQAGQIEPDFAEFARQAVRRVVDAFFTASRANLPDTAKLHLFRIAGKQLRYSMEIFAAAFPPSFAEQLYPQVVELQEKLGDVNDHVSALDRFDDWRMRLDGDEDRMLVERLADAERHARDDLLAAFFAFWTAERSERLRYQFSRELGDRPLAIRPGSESAPLPVAESG
jgi:CHAD domain-containing protein